MNIIKKLFVTIIFLGIISFVYAHEVEIPQSSNEMSTSSSEPTIIPTQKTMEPLLTEKAEKGQKLHNQHCQFCHARLTDNQPNQLYTRLDRRITNYMSLENQVLTCVNRLGIPWFEEEMTEVITYLNELFYQFELDKMAQ